MLRTFLWRNSPLLPRAALPVAVRGGVAIRRWRASRERKEINIRFINSGKRDKNVLNQDYFLNAFGVCLKNQGFDVVNWKVTSWGVVKKVWWVPGGGNHRASSGKSLSLYSPDPSSDYVQMEKWWYKQK